MNTTLAPSLRFMLPPPTLRGAVLKGLRFALLTLGLISGGTATASAQTHDDAGVRGLVAQFQDCWNRHDMESFAAHFVEDADFVYVGGVRWTGRAAIKEAHAATHRTHFKNSQLTMLDTTVRFLGTNVAIARTTWRLVGHTTRNGQPAPERRGILTHVVARQDGKWQVVVSQNTDIVSQP